MSKRMFLSVFILLAGSQLLSFDKREEKNQEVDKIDKSIQKALDYLLGKQTKDGHWASSVSFPQNAPDPKLEEIRYSIAITSLSSLALLPYRETNKEKIEPAIEKAVKYLVDTIEKNHKKLTVEGSFSFAYSLQFLLVVRKEPQFKELQNDIDKTIKRVIELVETTQVKKGGWNYGEGFKGTISFLTASILISLVDAKDSGFEIKENVIKDATKALEKLRRKNGAYEYETSTGATDIKDSLCRTAICELALYKAGITKKEDLKKAIENFFKHHKYVGKSLGNNQGYLFGHYYISVCLKICQKELYEKHLLKLANVILKKQNKDGSWVDSPNTAGKNYGAAIGILTLTNIKEGISK